MLTEMEDRKSYQKRSRLTGSMKAKFKVDLTLLLQTNSNEKVKSVAI